MPPPLNVTTKYLLKDTVAVVLAGGRGESLRGLTDARGDAAIPFGGKFRIIDFVLSNCVNSGIRQVAVLTQYKSQALIQHLHRGWSYLRPEMGEFVEVIPAQQQLGPHWYQGTADAVFQNLDFIRSRNASYVLILSGDQVYSMDYGPLIAAHESGGADITIGVADVPLHTARQMGVLSTDSQGRVTQFVEKPDLIASNADAGTTRISMGIYVMTPDLLERLLREDADNSMSSHDFGKDILPKAVNDLNVAGFSFQSIQGRYHPYWRDIGTVDAFYEANIELVSISPDLNIYDRRWPIWTYQAQHPPAKFVLGDDGYRGMAVNSMVAGGSIISGAHVTHSLLSSDVRVEEYSTLDSCVVLPGVSIGRHCYLKRCIIDEDAVIPDYFRAGADLQVDRQKFHVTDKGIVLVTARDLRPQVARPVVSDV
jgi:glucose-1-phosphate adenylyltransferase